MDGRKDKMKKRDEHEKTHKNTRNIDSNISSDFQTPSKKQRKARKIAESERTSSGSSDRGNNDCLESQSNELEDVSERHDEDADAKKKCPSCLEWIRSATFPSHVIYCLKKFQRDEPKSESSNKVVDSELVCMICQKDLSHMNENRRAQHQNKCLDKLEEIDSESVTGSDSSLILFCPICSFHPRSQQARSSHLKQCAKKHGVTSKKMLEIVQLQERQVQERKAMGLSAMPPPAPPRKVVQKTRNRGTTRQRQYESSDEQQAVSEEMEMAVAMSLSTSQEKIRGESHAMELLMALGHTSKPAEIPSKKRRKKTTKTETPLLLLRSDEDRSAIVSSRIEKILTEQKMSDHDSMVNWRKVPPHQSKLKQTPECRLWNLASLPQELSSDPSVFYVKDLERFVTPCKLKPGSKLKRLSQIPGYRTLTQSVHQTAEDNVDESEDDVPCTLDVLRNLAQNCSPSSQIASQGFFTSQASDVSEEEYEDVVTTEKDRMSGIGFLTMVSNNLLSDCSVELDDGNLIPCHRFPLYVNCRKAYSEIDEFGTLRWIGITRSTAIAFLQFVYCGTIVEKEYSTSELTSISERYCLAIRLEELGRGQELPLENANETVFDGQANEEVMVVDDDTVESSGKTSFREHSQNRRKKVALELVKSPSTIANITNGNEPSSELASKHSKEESTPNLASTSQSTNPLCCRRSLQFVTEQLGRNDQASNNDDIKPADFQHDSINDSVLKNDSAVGADVDKNERSPNLFDEPFEDDWLFDNINLVGLSQEGNFVAQQTDHGRKVDDEREVQRDTPCHQTTSVTRFQNSQLKSSVSTSTPKDGLTSHVDVHLGSRFSISPVGQCNPNLMNTLEKSPFEFRYTASASQHKKSVATFPLPSSPFSKKESILENTGMNANNEHDSNLLVMSEVADVVSESSFDGVEDRDVLGQYRKETEMSSQQNQENSCLEVVGGVSCLDVDYPSQIEGSQTSKKRKFIHIYEQSDVFSSSADVQPSTSSKRKRDDSNCSSERNESELQMLSQVRDGEHSGSCGFIVDSSNVNVWENFHDDGYYDCAQDVSVKDPTPGTSSHAKRKSVTFCERVELVSPSFTLKSLSENTLPDIISYPLNDEAPAEENELSPIIGNERKTTKKKSKKTEKKSKKTKGKMSVTPLPHYSVMPTPEIKKALSKIGVKPMPKKKASKLLKHVYEEMHPLESSRETEDASDPEPALQVDSNEKDETKKNKKLERSLNREKIKDFIESHTECYKDILQYKVIDLNSLLLDMRSADLNITESKLKRYLDKECITYSEHHDGWSRKRAKKRKST